MSNSIKPHPSSYRDPSGFVFEKDGQLYRQVNKSFKEDFDAFIECGLYEQLVAKGWLISHGRILENFTDNPSWYTTLKPERIFFVSYPYEWSFDMLKDAAILTLAILRKSLEHGMILKDATPFNIQWQKGRLIFIDTLSFERYDPAQPWIAYRQFCECFLSPLLLMHYSGHSLQQLMLAYPGGIPLSITSSLLPRRSKFSLHVYLNIHLHASISRKNERADAKPNKEIVFSKAKLIRLITSLETLIQRLKVPDKGNWSSYYQEAAAREDYLDQKKNIISRWLKNIPAPVTAADLGANQGEFSKLVSATGSNMIAVEQDPYCINVLYREIKRTGEKNIQPLVVDLSNPSPASGLNNEERKSFIERTHVDLVLALALIHHLAIGKNIPLDRIASLFHRLGKWLIIEFVPKEDEMIQRMLSNKKDIYPDYNTSAFENAFNSHFSIEKKEEIPGSGRTLYFMKSK